METKGEVDTEESEGEGKQEKNVEEEGHSIQTLERLDRSGSIGSWKKRTQRSSTKCGKSVTGRGKEECWAAGKR